MGTVYRTTPGRSPTLASAACRSCIALVVAAGALLFGTVELAAQSEENITYVDAATAGRWLSYLGLFLMVGAVAFVAVARRAFRLEEPSLEQVRARCHTMATRLGLVGALVFLLGAGGRLFGQVLAFVFPGDPVTLADARLMVVETAWGNRWLVQVACGVIAGVGFAVARARPKLGLTTAALGAIAVGVTLPLTGHAMAASWSWLVTLPLQAGHVIGGALWLGSLLVVTVVAFGATAGAEEEARERTIAELIHAFSPLAVAGVMVAVVLGLVLSVSYVGTWSALWTTAYGRVLLIKVFLLGVTGMIGAYNWRRVRPRLGLPGTVRTLQRSARVELLVGAV